MVQGNYSSSELRNFSARIPSIKYLLKIIRVFQIAQPLKCFNVVFLFVSFFCKTTWICCATIPRLNIRKIILSLCNILESVYSPQLISELERILWSINLWNQKKKKIRKYIAFLKRIYFKFNTSLKLAIFSVDRFVATLSYFKITQSNGSYWYLY